MNTVVRELPRLWEPLEVYRKGERVIDRERDDVRHTEEGGVFEALADHRAGYLNPRYVAKDRPGEFWKRVVASICPACEQPWSEHALSIDGYSPKCLPAKPRLVSRVLTAPIWLLNFLVNGDE